MGYFVSMQQTDFFHFSHVFTDSDARAILSAKLHMRFELSNGFGRLDEWGDVVLTFGTPEKCRLYDLNFVELCRQLSNQEQYLED